MKFDIHGDNVEITKAINEYIYDKISKLEKYFHNPDNVSIKVTAKIDGHDQNIEVTIFTDHFTFRGEEANEDLYAAIDLVSEKLEGQIRKNKTRIKKKSRKNKIDEINLDFEDDILEEFEHKEIVKKEKMNDKPMDVEEAILEMNLLGYNFFVFKDSCTNNVSVLYRKKDGNYAVIESE